MVIFLDKNGPFKAGLLMIIVGFTCIDGLIPATFK